MWGLADGSKYPLLRLTHKYEPRSVDVIVPEGYYVVYEQSEEIIEEEI